MGPPRLSLTTRGAFAVGAAPTCALAGLLLGAEELVLLAIALGTLLVTGLVQTRQRARQASGHWHIGAQLASSDAEVGRPLELVVTVVPSGRGGSVPTWLEDPTLRWRRSPRAGPQAGRRALPNPALALRVPLLESGNAAAFSFPVPTAYRGVYALEGHRLWCFDSVGLFAQVVGIGPSAIVSVHPVPNDVAVPDALLQGEPGPDDLEPVSAQAPRRHDNFGDFAGLRAYVPGDRLRLLYWPALARTGELMVRHFDDVTPHRVHLVADVRPLLGFRGTESVLGTVAGVGLQLLARGEMVELSTSAGERIGIGPGPHAAMALLRAIAAIDTAPPTALGRRRPRRRPTNAGPGSTAHGFAPVGGSPLVVTTRGGANALPGSLAASPLIIAP
jgi:hypothetical protein